jgi:integrase
MKAISYKFALRADFISVGEVYPVYLRVHHSRVQYRIKLPVSIPKAFWLAGRQRVSLNAPNSQTCNTLLEYYDAQARAYVSQCYIKQKAFSIEELQSALFGKVCTDDFFAFVEREIAADDTCSEATRRTYRAKMNKLRRFRPKLAISEAAEYDFLMDYKKEMVRSGNALNTWNKDLKIIRSFLNRAKVQGLIDSHAFLEGKIRLQSEDGNREALTLEELQRLRKLYQSAQLSRRHRRALQQFLFSCYTGLRYQDLHDLTWGEIRDGIITHVQHKTQDTVRIPLCNEAVSLLPARGADMERVLNVYSNQTLNRYLKEVIAMAGIPKKISHHCARHTFITLNISIGAPAAVVSRMAGHRNLEMTMHYADDQDEPKLAAMKKYDAALQGCE